MWLLILLWGFGAPTANPAGQVSPPATAVEFDEAELRKIFSHSPLPELPPDPTNRWADDPRAAHFGQFLFFDERLSGNGDVSCASCHDPAQGWADGRQIAEGLLPGNRNVPSLWNVGYQRWFFWDGRADTLWAQALHPLESPAEHGGSRLQYAHLVASDPALSEAYEAIFGELPDLSDEERFPPRGMPGPRRTKDPLHLAWRGMAAEDQAAVDRVYVNLGKALAAFQRRIRSGPAPFDEFVEGLRTGDEEKLKALTPEAQEGLKLFIGSARCRTCHHGEMFSDLEFHNILVPPLNDELALDVGRRDGLGTVAADPFNALGVFSDDPSRDEKERRKSEAYYKLAHLDTGPESLAANYGAFKTPSLRNVSLSAPYMHQGQFESLERVLEYYDTLEGAVKSRGHAERILSQLALEPEELAALKAFLLSLTNEEIDPALTRQPDSPLPE